MMAPRPRSAVLYLLGGITAVLLLLKTSHAQFISGHPQIWLAGVDSVVRSETGRQPADYAALFSDSAPWQNAAGEISVFKVSKQFILRAPRALLVRAVRFLAEHRIALAVESGIVASDGGCGSGVEGYNTIGEAKATIARLNDVGARLDYLALDEPWWFGHVYDGQKACRYTTMETAQRIEPEIRLFRAAFPGIAIGDIEPLGNPKVEDWPQALRSWLIAYRAVIGSYPAFLDLDIQWKANWKPLLPRVVEMLHSSSIPLGIIYDGNPTDESGAAWTRHAEERAREIELTMGITPQAAVIQTWMRHPEYMMPETKTGTMTNLVDRYVALHR